MHGGDAIVGAASPLSAVLFAMRLIQLVAAA